MDCLVSLTEEEYEEHTESYDGLCISCLEWTNGDVEPDAENYKCDSCGESKVMGAEQAMMCGHIEIVEE